MLKKFLSVLLAVMMVVSVMAVGLVSANALDSGKLYFNVNGTGWTMGDKDKVGFYVFPLSDAVASAYKSWGGKRLQGTDEGNGLWSYNAANFKLEEGVQYKIIFAHVVNNAFTDQTYDLFFDTTCLGHVASCNGTQYENPVDSTKKTLAAFWEGKDAAEYGPVLQISSIGNVIGTCPEQGKTPLDVFVDFISVVSADSGKTGLDNSRAYVVDIGTKTEQKLIDDIGVALGLTQSEVAEAFTANGVETVWTAADSVLPAGETPTEAPAPTEAPHVHTPGEPVQENVVPASCKEEGSYDEVIYCSECGEEISREQKTIDKLAHTSAEAVRENEVPASCKEEGSYDEVIYCSVCGEEISREQKTIDKLAHTPAEAVRENEVPASCKAEGSYDEVVYCSVCGEEISRETKTIDKLAHTPAEAVKENEVEADCENGGGYDEVVYCSVCGDFISSTHVDTDPPGHDIVFVDTVQPSGSKDGMKAHFECTRCGKLFLDAAGTKETTAEALAIKADHVRGDADGNGAFESIDVTVLQRWLAELPVTPDFDEVAADADNDEIIDIIDVTLMQRVLAEMTTFDKWDMQHKKIG